MPDPAILAAQLAAIQVRFPDWASNDQAQAEAAQLWGGGCNPHGVFLTSEREMVARHKDAEASVTIAQAPCGLFVAGVRFTGSLHGFGHAPKIWDEPHASREEARRAGIEEILAYLDDPNMPDNKATIEEIKQVRRQLQAQLKPTQQTLF